MLSRALVLICACLGLTAAHSAVVTATFQQLSGSTWAIDLEVTNDGDPDEITGFTVYFSDTAFAELTVAQSPNGWDSIAIQPDPVLKSAGFFDSLLLDPGAPLMLGEAQSGFRAEFTLLGADAPQMLPFDIVDRDFNVLFSGVTTPPIPEPAAGGMFITGVGVILAALQRRALTRGRRTDRVRASPVRG